VEIITFITPYFNSDKTIQKTLGPLSSLSSLQRESIEWIIIDDGSTQESYQKLEGIASEYPEVTVIREPNNNGASHARNIGIEAAKGRFLIFIDSDIQIDGADLKKLLEQTQPDHDRFLGIFTAGLHHPSTLNFSTRYKADYMNAIFAPYRGKRGRCSFIYGSLCGWKASYKFRWPEIRYGEDTYLAQRLICEGHQIFFCGDITLKHHKEYNLSALVKNDYLIPFYFARGFVDFASKKNFSLSFSHGESWQLAAIFLSALLLLSPCYPVSYRVLVLILWSLTNRPLFKEVLKGRKLKEKMASYFFTVLDQWIMGFGILFGLIHARFFRNPKVKM